MCRRNTIRAFSLKTWWKRFRANGAQNKRAWLGSVWSVVLIHPQQSATARRWRKWGMVKGQLQRFHKLISNDRIWPSEHGFEVIFEKSRFVFQISAFKVTNKRGTILGFTRFPKRIIGSLRLWRHKWSKLHDQYGSQWLTWPQSKWKLLSLMVFGRNYGSLCGLWLLSDSRKTKRISFYKFQADNQRRMQAVTTNDLRASSSKTTPNLIVQS